MPKLCEVEGCNREYTYVLYSVREDGSKEWFHVCRECEAEIGDRNMLLQGLNPRTGKLLPK